MCSRMRSHVAAGAGAGLGHPHPTTCCKTSDLQLRSADKHEDLCSATNGLTATMADEAAVVEEGMCSAQGPLVAVSFQKNVNRKQKYLEAEPKALGITQIGLSLFQVLLMSMFLSKDLSQRRTDIPFFILSIMVVIAGALAVAAQNLEMPTLRACLGMQVVACGASISNFILCLFKMDMNHYCDYHQYHDDNFTLHYGETCRNIEATVSHVYAEGLIIQVALITISTTLAAYCCKVVNCCTPAPKMPVITVQTPAVQQQ